MGSNTSVFRLARKGLAEGLDDDEIFELLTDHDVPADRAKSILEDVKESLSTSEKDAREALDEDVPDLPTSSDAAHDNQSGEAISEGSNEQQSETAVNTGNESEFRELDSVSDESSRESESFEQMNEDAEENYKSNNGGIFSQLVGFFSSNKDQTSNGKTTSSETQGFDEEENSSLDQSLENLDWDAEALKELARDAIDRDVAEEEILSLFTDHGIPESHTQSLLENAKQGRDETTEPRDSSGSEAQTESSLRSQDDDDRASKGEDTLNENEDDIDLETLEEDAEIEEANSQSFEQVFEDDTMSETKEKEESSDKSLAGTQGSAEPSNSTTSNQETNGKKTEATTYSSDTRVSATKLDRETLQAMAQHGIAKGFDRDELVTFFQNHGVEKQRAKRVIDTVLPSNKNTQGRKKSEHEGHTETLEAKDAVAVQKQEQVTKTKDEDDSFMSDVDKNQESLKVGRIYLTGRKPSYGQMQVQGLQDITGNEFESGGRTGFIDLSDTDKHIGGEEGQSDDPQQVDKDRIREQA